MNEVDLDQLKLDRMIQQYSYLSDKQRILFNRAIRNIDSLKENEMEAEKIKIMMELAKMGEPMVSMEYLKKMLGINE
jgi:hypothetical protein